MTIEKVPINYFDRGKPFYPLVMTYLIQSFGFMRVAVDGVIGARDIEFEIQRFAEKDPDPLKIKEAKQGLEKLLGPLELRSEFQNNHITIEPDMISKDAIGNFHYILTYWLPQGAGSLLILACEICKEKSYHNREPLWEFLRHCRNAAAHGGEFNFIGKEPTRPAKWGTFEITKSMQGLLLFKGTDGTGFLSPGDPIRLLWDIEQKYINERIDD